MSCGDAGGPQPPPCSSSSIAARRTPGAAVSTGGDPCVRNGPSGRRGAGNWRPEEMGVNGGFAVACLNLTARPYNCLMRISSAGSTRARACPCVSNVCTCLAQAQVWLARCTALSLSPSQPARLQGVCINRPAALPAACWLVLLMLHVLCCVRGCAASAVHLAGCATTETAARVQGLAGGLLCGEHRVPVDVCRLTVWLLWVVLVRLQCGMRAAASAA